MRSTIDPTFLGKLPPEERNKCLAAQADCPIRAEPGQDEQIVENIRHCAGSMKHDFHIAPIDPANDAEVRAWDQLVMESPDAPIFYHSHWILGLNRCMSERNVLFALRQGGTLVAGVALSQYGKYGFRGLRRPFATPYAAPFFLPSLNQEHRERILASIMEYLLSKFHSVTITSPFFSDPLASIATHVVAERTKHTYLLRIDNPDEMWTRFQSELRNRIRNATKLGICVAESCDARPFGRLYEDMFRAQGKRVHFAGEQIANLVDRLVRERIGTLYEAKDPDGDLHAAAFILHGKGTAYYALSATDPRTRMSGSNALLLWRIFDQIRSHSPVFDMVGANIPSISRFKKRFRGELVSYRERDFARNRLAGWLPGFHRRLRLAFDTIRRRVR